MLKQKMMGGVNKWWLSIIVAIFLLGLSQFWGCFDRKVDFNTEIRPILNAKCMRCHGGVKSQGDLSFLFREEVLVAAESGHIAVVPGKVNKSELIARITHHDPEERMPYEDEPLSEKEIDLFKRWIRQGAKWQDHWAYIPPKPYSLPKVKNRQWPQNGIDHFILAKLEEAELPPSEEAPSAELLRRLSLDLTGLPPTLEEVNAFMVDSSKNVYENTVDRLLASPHFGERWAAMWLDLARYADTQGYEKDPHRDIWKFRDWVIKAFNDDMPFDQFTIEQLAGDLLPNPSEDQLIATAFHRNTMNNTEGGTEDEEYRTATAIDRVNTTWTVWQSTTMECVQCHSHPYDPFKQEDYYAFYDFFNQSMDADLDSELPVLEAFSPEQDSAIEAILTQMMAEDETIVINKQAARSEQIKQAIYPMILPGDCDDFQDVVIWNNGWAQNWAQNPNNIPDKNFWMKFEQVDFTKLTDISYTYRCNGDQAAIELRLDTVDGELLHRIDLPQTEEGKWRTEKIAVELNEVRDVYIIPVNKGINVPEGLFVLKSIFLHEENRTDDPQLPALRDSLLKVRKQATRTPIMRNKNMGRQTHVFERGNWLVKGKAIPTAAVPAFLPQLPEELPKNRLAMAQWLVSPANPLAARVIVNRFWEQIFGIGIVETTEDFGSQGFKPTHPELLDWLALRFSQNFAWSIKALLKELVMSATYRQNSRSRKDGVEKDPQNLLLARGPRIRLTAEQLRDQALAVSGLLSDKMYGPSVMPYQPDSVWQVVYNGGEWKESEGEDKYRRALYTYWRRTSPYPSMVTFDSPSREFCVSRRIRTNTPLQALVTLNDPVYIEAAEAMAILMAEKGGESIGQQLTYGYQLALMRTPEPPKLEALENLYAEAIRYYQNEPASSEGIIKKVVNKVAADKKESEEEKKKENRKFPPLEKPQLKALAVVANAILNLDSFIMKE